MVRVLIQTSEHPEAGLRVPTAAASKSWTTFYDGEVDSKARAREAVDKLSEDHRHVRCFVGSGALGKMHYGVFRL